MSNLSRPSHRGLSGARRLLLTLAMQLSMLGLSTGCGASPMPPGSAIDSFYWMALLRSAAGYQAFRRRHPRGMAPEQVAAFLLSDPCFPRSVACCLGIIDEQLNTLRRFYGLRAAAPALEFLDEIRDNLEVRKVKAAIGKGELHRFDDFLQRSFNQLTSLIADAFFLHAPVAGEAAKVGVPA